MVFAFRKKIKKLIAFDDFYLNSKNSKFKEQLYVKASLTLVSDQMEIHFYLIKHLYDIFVRSLSSLFYQTSLSHMSELGVLSSWRSFDVLRYLLDASLDYQPLFENGAHSLPQTHSGEERRRDSSEQLHAVTVLIAMVDHSTFPF